MHDRQRKRRSSLKIEPENSLCIRIFDMNAIRKMLTVCKTRRWPFVFCLICCICFIIAVNYILDDDKTSYTCSTRLPAHCQPVCNQYDIDKRPNTVVLTSTNMGFVKMTENMLESIKRTRSCPKVIVVAEDEMSYKCLMSKMECYRGVQIQRSKLGKTSSTRMKIKQKIYKQFVKRRTRYILEALESGLDVLFADSDTFWVQDPFKDFDGDFDIAAHNEVHAPRKPVFCDGFAYYRRTENTISLVKEWKHLLDTHEYQNTMDQVVFNQLINRELDKNVSGGLKMKTLDPVNYPEGRLYYRVSGWREKHFNETKVMHFSYLHGYDDKLREMKKLGWWLVEN